MSAQEEPYYVYGYHATEKATVSAIMEARYVKQSRNWYDWLGPGSYFYQEAPLRAIKWLTQERHEGVVSPLEAGLLCVKIRIENFIDLLAPDWVRYIQGVYVDLRQDIAKLQELERAETKQQAFDVGGEAGPHPLDNYVIDMAVGSFVKKGGKVNGVRAIFYEGDPVFRNCPIFKDSHLLDRQHI